MYLNYLKLQNFRNYTVREFKFSSNSTLIIGDNAIGKTNILEAIYLLSTGKSFRAELEREMIKFSESMARVSGLVSNEDKITLEVVLADKKTFRVNGVSKRMMDFVGLLRCVIFRPEDIEIVTDSPSIRRRYLDLVLSQVDRDYRRSILLYEKGLRARNRILERIRDEGISRGQLFYWDSLLVKHGEVITQKRGEYIGFINRTDDLFADLNIVYEQSAINEERLKKYEREEVLAGTTLVGPHRDDFKIMTREKTGERDVSVYGSRGEQRLAIYWIKLGELEFIAETLRLRSGQAGERPLLLLDDIFSELDHSHRQHILEIIPKQQTIMTTTDLHLVDKSYIEKFEVIELK